jgi:hypothetical protein
MTTSLDTYFPTTILSSNTKTGCSINLPIAGHCTPTKNCAACCYAKSGHTALPTNKRKQVWVSQYLKGPNISQLIQETRAHTAVRLSGTGDISLDHINNLLWLAQSCPNTMLWGMTRKLDVATELNGRLPNLKLLVSVDSSSPDSVWNYPGKLCFGPRLAGDKVPADRKIVTVFPYHFAGRVVNGIPRHKKDCKAVHHEISGCMSCGRCWKW